MKTSNKIAIAVAIIFMVIPAISYIVNYINVYNCGIKWHQIESQMHGRSIKVLELLDEHTALIKNIYRTKHTHSFQVIHHNMWLGATPEVFEIVGDTLKVKMPNNGYPKREKTYEIMGSNGETITKVYYGPEIDNTFFNLNGLEYIIRNGKKYAINITGLDKHGTEEYVWEEVVE